LFVTSADINIVCLSIWPLYKKWQVQL